MDETRRSMSKSVSVEADGSIAVEGWEEVDRNIVCKRNVILGVYVTG